MRLGRKMHHRLRPVFAKHPCYLCRIANIHLLERIARIPRHAGERFKIASVGELVDIDDGIRRMLNDVADDGRTDKAGTAGDEYLHAR